ncbi:transcriptional regulator [Halarcobacter ebronensis]|uniref:Transcriptional regulator n=1 Tax=Halarcobacter ebronensis TaxID=1462615 RepID=A0A4V1LR63_9BACT|nr:response regulator transcription factor [Halarcobacter ebronensis]RXJ67098.1 transcriptional regulator [Halarcobacter ebronensis]
MQTHHSLEILKKLTILYVEDEENIRDNITKVLKLMCDKIFATSNGLDALNIFNENHIDIILSDINLPKMSGLEFVSKIREGGKRTPAILLSAYTDTPYLLHATKLKLVDYLVKPLDFSQLKEALIKASQEIYDEGNFIIKLNNNTQYNISEKVVLKDGKSIKLTGKEIALIELLLKNRNHVVNTLEIKDVIWEDSYEATDSALKAVLNKLRNKIGKDAIKNISGIGYQIITS